MYKKLARFLKLPKGKLGLNDSLLLLLPVALWFGYHPIIAIGATDSMNLELSLIEIFLTLFAITALPRIWQNRQELLKNKAVWLTAAFALWNTVSLVWTPNLLRGLLTTGLVWLLMLAFWGVLSNKNLRKFTPTLLRLFIASAVVMSGFAWLQVIVGTLSGTDEFLLCLGCVASQFGFARATGFVIEPQFFGSLLLAPTLILCHLKFRRPKHDAKSNTLIIFLIATLFLTLSRGAIYAFALGLLILLVLSLKQLRKVFCVAGLALGGFIMALVLQGALAQANSNLDESFAGTTAKVIHQLSLGVIDLRPQPVTPEVTATPVYDGYVEESTTVRLSLSRIALDTWSISPPAVIFGSGVGGSGMAMNAAHPEQTGAKEIVQNEYLEVLLELGIIGFLIFSTAVIGLFYATRRQKWFWAILIAFLTQWLFFSGYPNALHVYLLLAIIFVNKE